MGNIDKYFEEFCCQEEERDEVVTGMVCGRIKRKYQNRRK